jgi:hypothetical protein
MKTTLAALLLFTSLAMADTKWFFMQGQKFPSQLIGESKDGKIKFVFSDPIQTRVSVSSFGDWDHAGKTYSITVEVDSWKSPQKWTDAPDREIQAPPGVEILKRLIAGTSALRLRYFPPGKQSAVADFERGNLDTYIPQITAELKAMNSKPAPKPAPIGVR